MDPSSKENKSQYFRKSQSLAQPQLPARSAPRGQHSLDTMLPSNRPPSHSPSIGSIELEGIRFGSAVSQPTLQNLQNLQSLQNLQNLQNIQALQTLQNLQIAASRQQKGKGRGSSSSGARMGQGSNPGNSGSLDETEIRHSSHHHSMPAPRRARSAERFDGMRVHPLGNGELPLNPELVARSYRSPQVQQLRRHESDSPSSLATIQGPVKVSQAPVPSNTPGVRRPVPILPGHPGQPHPSPPPSYTTAVNEKARDPPPYHQVIGAQTQLQSQQANLKGNLKGQFGPNHKLGIRNQMNLNPKGQQGQGLRSVASTPAFPNIDNSCGCQKCELQGRFHETEYNDAVYMESQAFLMHEIMTDGMAFCSIV